MQILRQSTTATVKFGPFVDATDGVTAETGLSIAQADIRLTKNGGDFAQSNNSAGAAHDEAGYYDVPLDTTDTNTCGRLRVAVAKSGAAPVWQDFQVVEEAIYDALYAASATGLLPANVTQVGGGAVSSADDLKADVSGLATAAALATVDGNVDSVLEDTGTTLPATLSAIAGYIDTEVAAIKAVTDALPDDGALTSLATAAALATVDGNVDAVLVDTGTTIPAQISGLNNLSAAGVLAAGDVDGYTLEQSLKLILSAVAGKLTGAATTTIAIRAADDSKARITATVDADGNRSAVTLDATG